MQDSRSSSAGVENYASLVLLKVHPDALYDAPYEAQELRRSDYQTLDFSGALQTVPVPGGIELRSEHARLRITAPAGGSLRIQAVPRGEEIPLSTTEALGLLKVQGIFAPYSWSFEEQQLLFQTPFLSVRLDISTVPSHGSTMEGAEQAMKRVGGRI